MPFPKVDKTDQVRYGAYHEATHTFFAMYFGPGIHGEIEVHENGIGNAQIRTFDILDPKATGDTFRKQAIILLAPRAVEQTLRGRSDFFFTAEELLDELSDFPGAIYPEHQEAAKIYMEDFNDDFGHAACALMISALEGKATYEFFNKQKMSEDKFEGMLRTKFEDVKFAIFDYLSDEPIIDAIVELAESLYEKRVLSKQEVLDILEPFFIAAGWDFKVD